MASERTRDASTRMPPGSRWALGEAGNTLVLAPVAILIVFGLGAVALDSATLFLGQRRLSDLAVAVARDAVAAVDLDHHYGGPPGAMPILSATSAEARRSQLVAFANAAGDRSLADIDCVLVVDGARATATCTGASRPILAPMLPGMARTHELRSTAIAEGRLE